MLPRNYTITFSTEINTCPRRNCAAIKRVQQLPKNDIRGIIEYYEVVSRADLLFAGFVAIKCGGKVYFSKKKKKTKTKISPRTLAFANKEKLRGNRGSLGALYTREIRSACSGYERALNLHYISQRRVVIGCISFYR